MAKHSEAIQGTEKEFLDEFQKLCYSRSSWQVCRICVYSKYDYKSFDGACTVP